MNSPKLQLLGRTIQRLLRRGADASLSNVLAKSHAADLAFIFNTFSVTDRQIVIRHCIDDAQRAEVLSNMDVAPAAELLFELPRSEAAGLLNEMEPDDVSSILRELDQEVADELLTQMQSGARNTVEDLSRYDDSTAGSIMSPRLFSLHRDTTARQAIEALHPISDDLEMVFYVYVVNELQQLLGVVSLRQLVINKPDTKLFDLMTSDVISVRPEEDQEEVARLAARYGLLAIPVVDLSNKLLGIVTVDDVIDVLQEEAKEDILRMAGAGDRLGEKQSFLLSISQRFPWLLAASVGGLAAAGLMATFVDHLRDQVMLMLFIPLVLGLAGVMAMQSAAVIAMKIMQGHLDNRRFYQIMRHTGLGLLFGCGIGALLGGGLYLWSVWSQVIANPRSLALMIGGGIMASMVVAAGFGAFLPMVFDRLRIDPALATGPAVAISVDILALFGFLWVSYLLQ